MNKKFSTLLAGFLLAGSVNAFAVAPVGITGTTVIPAASKADYFAAGKSFKAYISTGTASQLLDTVHVRIDKDDASSPYKVTLAAVVATTVGTAPTTDAPMFTVSITKVNGTLQLKLKAGNDDVIFKDDGSFLGAGAANAQYADNDIKDAVNAYTVDAAALGDYDPADNSKGLKLALTGFTKKTLNYAAKGGFSNATGTVVFFYLPDDAAMAVADLNKMYGNGFSLKFPTMSPAISANPFTSASHLQAVTTTDAAAGTYLAVGGTFTAAEAAGLALNTKANIDKFKAATFIVMDTIPLTKDGSSDFNGKKGAGYQFKAVKGADLITAAANGATVTEAYNKRHAANAQFTIKNNPNNTDSLIVELAAPVLGGQTEIMEDQDPVTNAVRVSVVNFNSQNIVTTYCEEEGITPAEVDGKVKWTLITLGNTTVVAQKDLLGVVNITSLNYLTNGKVFGPAENISTNADAVDAKLVQFTKPEGQFLVTSSADGMFTFTNRESGNTYGATNGLRKVSDGIYTQANGDTLKIVAATTGDKFNGFKNYSQKLELDKTVYNLSVFSAVTDNVYLTEKHSADHLVGLSTDVANAAKWKLVKFESDEVEGDDAHLNDSIIISRTLSSLKDGKYNADKKDSLVVFTYAIYNEANGEFLSYNGEKKAFYCNPAIKTIDKARATGVARFAIKEKADGTYNLIVINDGVTTDYSTFAGTLDEDNNKLYGAFSENKVNQNAEGHYDLTDNDLFVIEPVAAPQYRSVSLLDTVSIYKNDNNKVRLYERNGFLGMQHIADVEKMAPAMVVDTAYVRDNTNKPQYLLLVRPEYVYHNGDCEIPNHPAVPSADVDTVKGSFLVNMVDSAAAWGNKHDNPYIWDNYSKLAFVKGYHTNDTLVIVRSNQVKGDSIWVGENNNNTIGKYAFRYVDRDAKSFVIETSFDGTDKVGYIKWLNGTPVVVNEYNQAEVFNMNEDEKSNPTDNETVATTTVSVIAGEGQVVVNNAAGKTVAIINLLGESLAKTVLTSDNAIISVPAGIVVVAVEGEAAVKAIVR